MPKRCEDEDEDDPISIRFADAGKPRYENKLPFLNIPPHWLFHTEIAKQMSGFAFTVFVWLNYIAAESESVKGVSVRKTAEYLQLKEDTVRSSLQDLRQLKAVDLQFDDSDKFSYTVLDIRDARK